MFLTAAVAALLAVIPRLDPLQDGVRRSAPLLHTVWAGLLALMLVVEATIAAPAFDLRTAPLLPLLAVGAVLMAIGNALPKSRPNFLVGIRTPWTITDPDNWIATHRLGARTMILGGATIFVSALLPMGANAHLVVVVASVALSVIPPLLYSYLHWLRRGGAYRP